VQVGLGDQPGADLAGQPRVGIGAAGDVGDDRVDAPTAWRRPQHRDIEVTRLAAYHGGQPVRHLLERVLVPGPDLP
jgi:hypothetical protein